MMSCMQKVPWQVLSSCYLSYVFLVLDQHQLLYAGVVSRFLSGLCQSPLPPVHHDLPIFHQSCCTITAGEVLAKSTPASL